MRVTALAVIGVLGAAGCTNYQPLPPTAGGSWNEARRALYGKPATAVPADAPASDAPVTATTSSAGTAQPSAAPPVGRDAPVTDALEPKPLPPLRTTSSAPSSRDDPVVAAAPAAAEPDASPSPSAPARTETAAPAEERVVAAARPAEPTPAVDADASLPPPALSGVGFLWPAPAAGDTVRVTDVGDEGALAIEAPAGEPFVAAENGVVVFAGDDLAAYGRMVVVRHDGDYTTAYGHAERLDVAVGDVVRRGQRLGLIGRTGEVTAPQLYFEMRIGSRVVDPRAYLVEAPRLVAGG
jgi:murein DD-endopeptidase MepM/ murein hydrolase activator NlpD